MNEAFLRTGAIHFLTVSGFHVGVLGATVWMLLRFALRRGPRSAAICTAGVLVVYATIAEPNAPVFRATIMALLFCAARVTGRDFATHNWLPAAAIVLLLFDPQQLFRAGFQLSFLQVAVLVAFFPKLANWRPWRDAVEDPRARDVDTYAALAVKIVERWLWGLLLVSVLAWAGSWPLVVYHFERFAPWAPLQALLISPMVIATILLGFATVLLGPLPAAGELVGKALHATTDGLLWLVHVLGQLPGALLEAPAPPAAVVFLTYGLALTALYAASEARRARAGGGAKGRRAGWLLAATGATFAIPAAWFGAGAIREGAPADAMRLCVLDVGNGSATLIITEDQTMLVDAGTLGNFDAGETVRRALNALRAPDATRCVISHANFDHFSGVPTLVSAAGVRQVAVNPYFRDDDRTSPAAKLLDELRSHDAAIQTLKRGDRFAAGASTIDVLWPPATGAERLRANDSSLVLKISHPSGRVLLPGDLEREGIGLLLDACDANPDALRADVLIAPHHGDIEGDATADLLAAVDPTAIIVSTARDRSAFAELARDTLGKRVRVYSTRRCGAVVVEFTADRSMRISSPFARDDDGSVAADEANSRSPVNKTRSLRVP
ncbi:MAG: ComEC/Rec2 family competence protein [Planctomycetota bacterium]|nr:MAG: ComEC/Rec2 family competence protein [Planctomycetota bacterium]